MPVLKDWDAILSDATQCVGDRSEAKARGLKYYSTYCNRCEALVPRLVSDFSCVHCNRVTAKENSRVNEDARRANRLKWIRRKAKERGHDFDLDKDWYDANQVMICPALGIPLIFAHGTVQYNSASFDRIEPSKGYTKDNVKIISTRANRIKSDANAEEVIRVGIWMLLNEMTELEARQFIDDCFRAPPQG